MVQSVQHWSGFYQLKGETNIPTKAMHVFATNVSKAPKKAFVIRAKAWLQAEVGILLGRWQNLQLSFFFPEKRQLKSAGVAT